MALHRELERRLILSASSETARQSPHDDMLALDHAGRPVMHSPSERCRQVAERWGSSARDAVVTVQTTIDVKALQLVP